MGDVTEIVTHLGKMNQELLEGYYCRPPIRLVRLMLPSRAIGS